jgi:hypothetical protein
VLESPATPDVAERCAVRSARRGEPLLGTAFVLPRVLLVEQPGPWGSDGLLESRFGTATARALKQRTEDARVRLLAVRRPGRSDRPARRTWGFADSSAGRESLRWGEFDADAELLDLPLDGSAGVPDADPAYLVCTHSAKDPCCALAGRRVAAALDVLRPGRVWESSHVGGHRFAANVLTLPDGLLYGRVEPDQAAGIVTATDAGDVVTDLLRGQIGVAPAAQAALAFAHRELGVPSRASLAVLDCPPPEDGQVTVTLRGPAGRVRVVVAVEPSVVVGPSCGDVRSEPGNDYLPVALTVG